ncbi:hypothetical protein VT84_09320 [Gemmata sp. SH-PL17]|uniref:hypothetical protein n=1 Tax=Gemmata sp. SH-PL17 TaxID=1630693 RepID=UPI00078DD7B7|nr:hypothetical protein [Gemmata sp. SH-PL17]AMV24583.1 hypothetical protein VT84_09320 [Gemmata sp. SH-PL17]
MQNYELGCQFGAYAPKSVVPEHVFVGHDLPRLVDLGLVSPTDKAVNVPLEIPKPVAEKAPDTVIDERNRLADENTDLRKRNATYDGVVKELEKQRDAFKKKCDEYTVETEHLKGACEEHQKVQDRLEAEVTSLKAEVARLTTDLDNATKPGTQAPGDTTKK